MSVTVIRHGETAWSLRGEHTGTTDIPLTEAGKCAATRLWPALVRLTFAVVLTSPLRSARDTCELAGLGQQAIIDPDLMEWNYGDYEGRRPTRSTRQRQGGRSSTMAHQVARALPRCLPGSIA